MTGIPGTDRDTGSASYAAAGVDIAAGERAVDRIRDAVASTRTPGVLADVGGFAGMYALGTGRWREPVLAATTDGVGTKAYVAADAGVLGTIGVDLVAMCVDDLVCCGATPLFLLDYVAVGDLDEDGMAQLVGGVAAGCRHAGCALIGGEMAVHPGGLPPGHFDLVGSAVGAVERDAMLGPERVRPGAILVGLASPGLRSNGYALARHVLLERAGLALDGDAWEGAGRSLAEVLLEPSRIYAPAVLAAIGAARGGVQAAAHVTGGGLEANLARVLPSTYRAQIDRSALPVPRIFAEIQRLGNVDGAEMERVFNLGIGMVLVVAPDAADTVLESLAASGEVATVVGEVRPAG